MPDKLSNEQLQAFIDKTEPTRRQAVLMARECLEARGKPRWVSVGERLPDDGAKVLVCRLPSKMMAGFIDVAYFAHPAIWRNYNWHRDMCTDDIPYWMPLPDPPAAAAEKGA